MKSSNNNGNYNKTTPNDNNNLIISETSFIETLINTIPSPIYYKDINGYYINCNTSFEDLVQEKKNNIIGKKNSDLSDNNFFIKLDLIEKKHDEFQKVKNIQTDFLNKNNNSKYIIINVDAYYNSKKNLIGFIGSIHDISEYIFIEKALKDSEERYRFLIESTLVAIIVHVKGKIAYTNNEGIKLLGAKSIDELIGRDIIDFIHPDYSQIFNEKALNVYSKENNISEQRLCRLDNKKIYAEVRIIPFLFRGDPSAQIIAYDITERKNAEKKVKNALKEKEILLQEIHHRVKNNLQTISALILLQTYSINDEKINAHLNDVANRINSMSLVHQKLYQTKNFNEINFKDYIKTLIDDILKGFGCDNNNFKIIIDIKRINLNIDTAIPCGLIINEIITNSLKYAFKDIKNPVIGITMQAENKNMFSLIIYDNGAGLPENYDYKKSQKLGIKLIDLLTKQLKGNFEIINSNGVKYIIKLKKIMKLNNYAYDDSVS